ncbi:MAG: winged helix DNA-binding domain-containing protein [Vallitaleaceae bacterium]|jgi:uncharacterized protein YcaQ|nr:winged helix DNA-binding domain-containing protein [Vallitaleaceae bacterium]
MTDNISKKNRPVITKKQAREFMVAYHHLNSEPLKGKEGILIYLEQISSIQFDPLDQVGNNTHLVLQSRIAGYKKQNLLDLLYEDRKLLDGWDKCLCIYLATDWIKFGRYHRGTKLNDRFNETQKENKEAIVQLVRKTIKEKGPVSSSDIEIDGQMDWHWAPTTIARAALEYMYYSGDLIIHHKKGTRKYYNLIEHHYSSDFLEQEDGFSDDQEFFNWLLLRRIGAVGMLWNKASDSFIGMRGFKSAERNRGFRTLEENGLILPVEVEGCKDIFYIKSSYVELLEQVKVKSAIKDRVSFLAPLDNMLWDRKMIVELFDFDYKWEVYTPSAERKYGYYVLPILYKDALVGRFEPVLDKKTKVLTIKSWWWEDDFKITAKFKKALIRRLKAFGTYLDAKEIIDAKEFIEI